MKWRTFVVCVLAILVVEMAGSLSGELSLPGVIKTRVPFAFQVGASSLPAGDYTARSWGGDGRLVLLQGPRARAKVIATDESVASTGLIEPRMVFRHTGTGYVLSELWFQGESSGRKLTVQEPRLIAKSEPAAVVVRAGSRGR